LDGQQLGVTNMTKSKTPKVKPIKANPAPQTSDIVTLADLCEELKIKPREARMMLRLAIAKKGKYPALTETHIPRHPWQWEARSKALDEAKAALKAQINQ